MNNTLQLRLRMRSLCAALLAVLLLAGTAWAQTRTITGTVTDKETGGKLAGVRIVAKGTRSGGVTDGRGNFKIDVPETSETLVFTYVGYAKKEVAIAGQSVINAVLDVDARSLDDVVVTAFGVKQEKKALGYAVQEVSGAEILGTNQPNVVAGLQGRVAGVTITNSGGAVGGGSQIIIRGISSLSPGGDNQPLFVVDGIPISNATQTGNVQPSTGSNAIAGSNEQFAFTNRAADINPDDIESINVLKGPAATALYGLRAANGVVIITTKRGISGKTLITFSSDVTIDQVGKTPTVQTRWGQGSNGADTSDRRTNFQSYGLPRSLNPNDPFFDNFRNFFQTGTRFDQRLTVSGGTENTRFFTSVSRMDQRGIVPGTDFTRTTVGLRGSANLDEKFSVSASVNYSNSGGSRPNNGDRSIFSALNFWIPTYDVNDAAIAAPPIGQRTTDPYQPIRTVDGRITNIVYNDGVIDSPLFFALRSQLRDNVNRVFGDVKFDYQPFSWLKATYQFTLDYYNDSRRRVAPPEVGPAQTVNGFIVEESLNRREINSQLFITASQDFGDDLSASLTLGNAITDIENYGTSSRGETFSLNDFYDLSNTTNRFNSRIYSLQRLVGFFADARLTYKNMLFLSLTGRNDLSSTLPSQNRSFFYPSASLSFAFSELTKNDENFNWLTFGKLRASWAEVGKDGIGPYRIGEYYTSAGGFPIGNVNGFRLATAAGSNSLRPERKTGIEFGLEAKLFDNRFGFDVTYFTEETRDQIVDLPVSNTTGFATFLINGGTIRNTGVEVLINATPVLTNEFSWDMTLNWSRVRGSIVSINEGINEILYLDGIGYIISKAVRPGGSDLSNPNPAVGDLYGYDFVRNANGQVVISPDGFPTVDFSRQVKVGNAIPDWQAGLTNTFSWNGLSLSFLLEWRQGGQVMDLAEPNRFRNGVSGWTDVRYRNTVFNGVDAQGNANTTPALWQGVGINTTNFLFRNFNRTINAYQFNLQDASWFRLRNISLSYNLPKSLFGEGSFVKGLRVTLTGNNLWLSTPFRGFDPDGLANGSGANTPGFVGRNTPLTRSYAFGIALTF
jgi:TonB-linked SusC/RagA family outer membrane protein